MLQTPHQKLFFDSTPFLRWNKVANIQSGTQHVHQLSQVIQMLTQRGHLEAHVKITGDNNVTRRVEYRLVGPSTRPAAPRPTSTPASGGAPTPADSGVKP